MEKEELNWWFGKLSELNDTQRKGMRARGKGPINRSVNRALLYFVVFPLIVAVSLAVAMGLGAPSWTGGASLFFLAITYLGVFLSPLVTVVIHWKSAKRVFFNPFSVILENAHFTASVDRQYLEVLSSKPLESIEFVLMELKFERDFFERRLALIVGAIERIGMLPGVLAIVVVLSRLGDGQPDWVYAVAYATPVLYLFAVFAHFFLMRLDRMVRIMEMIVDWKQPANR